MSQRQWWQARTSLWGATTLGERVGSQTQWGDYGGCSGFRHHLPASSFDWQVVQEGKMNFSYFKEN
jgi:hypothetical protein